MAATNAQLQAQVQELTRRLNAMAPIVSALGSLAAHATFLASLSRLPHQTTSNGSVTVSTPGGANAAWYSNVESALNGVVNAVNILQSDLQGNGFES